jgi:hypothetical protein
MDNSNFWYVLVYDPHDGPSANEYIFFIRFEAIPERNWGPNETAEAVAIWAKRLIQPDGSVFIPGFDRLRVLAKPMDEAQAIKSGLGYEMGAGITIWVGMLPPDSRLRNEVLWRFTVQTLRCEVALQTAALQAING